MKILVVDDEPFVLELIEMILKKDGHALSMAGDGQEGVKKISEESFDAILTDLNMPHVSGLELAKAAKAINPQVKIALMSGLAEKAPNGGLPPNIDFMLDKPLRIGSLCDTIARMTR